MLAAAELEYRTADRLAAAIDPELRHQLLDVADAVREPGTSAHYLYDCRCRIR
jgi:hypothetical protein